MHFFWTGLLAAVALLWILAAIETWPRRCGRFLRLKAFRRSRTLSAHSVSVLVAARDEEEKLPGALATFLALDYPRYEVIAVDDRSVDATGSNSASRGAERFAAETSCASIRFHPAGSASLTRCNAPTKIPRGEWLVLTDADVHFRPDLLRRALAAAQQNGWEHLTLLGQAKMFNAGEKIAMSVFLTRISDGHSSLARARFAFWRIRGRGRVSTDSAHSAYEKMGTHRRLAMEVVDDMKLGKLAKEAGVRSAVARAGDAVSVHWHAGISNMILGTTKNFFATTGFRVGVVAAQIFGLVLAFLFPVVALPFAHGWARAFDLVAIVLPVDRDGRRLPRISRLAALCVVVSHRRADFYLDAGTFDHRHAVEGRHRMARHVLSARRIETRRCVM